MKVLVRLLLFFVVAFSYGQKEANIWYFGQNAGIDFNTKPPSALTDGKLNTLEGCTTFSDANGALLFYVGAPNPSASTLTVWDNEHQIMNYTDGSPATNLLGNTSSTQSALAIPKPGSTSVYYLFTVDDGPSQGNPGLGFKLYTIDMSLNGGLGELIDEDSDGAFFTDLSDGKASEWTEKVTAVRGSECNTYWIISAVGTEFYAYKIDTNGVNLTPVISQVNNSAARRGYLKVSPDGTKLAIANQANFGIESLVYSFNNQTGAVANDGITLINDPSDGEAYGVEFSRDSKKLYISTVSDFRNSVNFGNAVTYKLFQFDVSATDITSSKTLIHEQNPNTANTAYPQGGFRGALQLGPNGKIYATIPLAYSDGFATHLDVIENPGAAAADVIFTKNAIDLGTGKGTQGLPPFISSLLLPIEIKDADTDQVINNQDLEFCIGETKTIAPEIVTGANITHTWTFNDGTTESTIGTTATLILNNIQTNNAGIYKLVVEMTDDCGNITRLEGEFNVEVFESANATAPTDWLYCDADGDGLNAFDLQTIVSPQVLNGLDPAIFDVVYFTDQTDAQNNVTANALPEPYTNPTAFSNQTIYVRVHNKNAPNSCFALTNFSLSVTGIPVPQTPVPYEICDDLASGTDTDGFVTSFVLATKDVEILGTLSTTQYTISYHTTLLDAQTSSTTNPIDKGNPYRNTTVNTQQVFIRVENNDNTNCFDASKTMDLVVSPLPIITSFVELKQCDNDTDGFSNFNLNEAASDISTDFTNETFVFYPTFADAQSDSNAIINAAVFTNRVVTTDTVWARAITTFGCYRIAEVTLTVSTTGIPASFQRSFTVCDDFLDTNGVDNMNNDDTDGVATFDFSSVTPEIIAIFPASQQLTINYYRNEADALAETNAIADPSAYRNIGYATTQQIYVRVDSKLDNDCLGFGAHITLNVDPTPTSAIVSNLELCDDFDDGNGTNGLVQSFDLNSQTPTILGSQNPANYSVTYHSSSSDAATGNNPLSSPYTNTTRDLQTIYVRVENILTGCYNDHVSFDLIVHPLPIANFVDDIEICDEDSDGSARNGFSQSIDLEVQTAGILGTQDPADYTVTYHSSLVNAQNGVLPLGSPFSNTVPDRQRIYVRVFNQNTQCANGISNFDVVINPEPIATVVSNLAYCDDDTDGDDTNGFVQQIDLDSQITAILGTTQSTTDFEVTFHLTDADATIGDNAVSSPFSNTIANQQTIYVRVQDKRTGCVNDDLSFDVLVNSLPDFQVTTPQIVCLNGPSLTIYVENPDAVYTYLWTAPDGSSTTDDLLVITVGGLYTITATTTNGTGCSRTRTIQVNESIIATITEEDVTIIDDSDNNSIAIDNADGNLGIGDYEFALADANGFILEDFQDEPFFDGLQGGIYTILVRDKNDCGVASLEVPVVTFPKFFTPNNDGYNDTWSLQGVNTTFFPTSKIYIFNRYGKVVADIPVGSQWDGTYLGKKQPSNDYWFNAMLVDYKGNIRSRKGNFSLLRK